MKKLLTLFLLLFSASVFADTNLSKYFTDKSGCFILYDLNKSEVVTQYNPPRCSQQISPDSTFKIPLSLMAFDQNLITQKTVFKWDGQKRMFAAWNQDQTPQTWLKNSIVWVSQQLTPKLGMDKIQYYLHQFNYGNEDFSGGITRAWLTSSLKISADEQLGFLRNFVTDKLPVSKAAIADTKANLYLETLPNDWKLYGKTGSGGLKGLQDGWFIGFIQKEKQIYIFVLNFSELQKPTSTEFAGARAKKMVKEILATEHLI